MDAPAFFNFIAFILLIIGWFGVLLRSNLLLYLIDHRSIAKLNKLAPYLILEGSYGYAAIKLYYRLSFWAALYPLLIYLFILLFISYRHSTPEFKSLKEVSGLYTDIAEEEPEMVVVEIENSHHIIPLKYLRAMDLVVTTEELSYSLTYCLLCNTSHAYILPEIDGEQVKITSWGGTVMNGNKVLMDEDRDHIWQQFDGKPLTEGTPELTELRTSRHLWNHVPHLYSKAKYAIMKINLRMYNIYQAIGKLFARVPWLRIGYFEVDQTIPPKSLVTGVQIIGGDSRAYPFDDFIPGESKVIEDQLGDEPISIVYDGDTVIGFKATGLSIDKLTITREEESWNLEGKAINADEDLPRLMTTQRVYWYIWKQFNPTTTIYGR